VQTAKLLIIDNQPESVALLIACLGDQIADIWVALDGDDGLSKARQRRPDVILLDIALPRMDGFAVCEQIKADPATRDVAVVFLSASDTLDDKLHAFAVGGSDYITKPFSSAEVLARVSVHLAQRQRLRRLEAIAASQALDAVVDLAERDRGAFRKAIEILQRDMADPPVLAELGRELGLSERRLTDLFREQIGTTVYDYFAELRLETARHLLEGSTVQVQLIADRVGYRKPGDLTRAFRRRYGVSPREYRQARQGRDQEAGEE
jgi:DNA-binding response OmpR family regulator